MGRFIQRYDIQSYDFVYKFSRKIIWLKLSTSNHDPKIIARYYLEAVEEAGGTIVVSCGLAIAASVV